jgi:AcrR family transcriptional regulator
MRDSDEMTSASTRRIGTEESATRHALLDAAMELLVEEGYASVTSRKVAAKAGLKPQLVHYYFRTMDDLYVALVRRGAEQNAERQQKALASDQPLRELWALSTETTGGILNIEFSALANHRKAIRAELVALAEEFRNRQTEAFATILARYGVPRDELSPEALAVISTGLSQILVLEDAMGISAGHRELRGAVDAWIERYEPARAR